MLACPSSVIIGETVTCTATVTDKASMGTAPTGMVSLTVNGKETVTSCKLSDVDAKNTASCVLSYTPASTGTNTATATYAGDGNHEPSTSSPGKPIKVNPKDATSTAVVCSPSSLPAGQSTTCTVIVTDAATPPAAVNPPSGTVTISASPASGTAPPCTPQASAAAGTLTCSFSLPLPPGSYTVSASYSGDGSHLPSTATRPAPVTFTDPTTSSVACSPSPVAAGTMFTCTALVTDTATPPSTPTGSIAFTVDGAPGKTCPLQQSAPGTATCSFTDKTGSGTFVIGAAYGGDTTHSPSTAQTTALTVIPPQSPSPSTATRVACSPSSLHVGQSATCTATVTDSFTSPAALEGIVTFFVNGTRFGACGLRGAGFTGPESCSVPGAHFAARGRYTITAAYGGDSSGHNASDTADTGSAILAVTAAARRRKLPQLWLTLRPGRFAIDRCTRVRLTVTAGFGRRTRPLKGAVVSFVGVRTRTDRHGVAFMTACFRRPGIYLAKAQLRGFSRGSVRVRATRRRR